VNKIPQRQQQTIGIVVFMAICVLVNVYNLAKNARYIAQTLPSNTLAAYHAAAYGPERFQILLYLNENFRNWRLVAPSREFVEEDLQYFELMFIEAGGQTGVDYHDYDVHLTEDEAEKLEEYRQVWFENGEDIDIHVVFSDRPEISKTNWLALYNQSLYIIPQSLAPIRMQE